MRHELLWTFYLPRQASDIRRSHVGDYLLQVSSLGCCELYNTSGGYNDHGLGATIGRLSMTRDNDMSGKEDSIRKGPEGILGRAWSRKKKRTKVAIGQGMARE